MIRLSVEVPLATSSEVCNSVDGPGKKPVRSRRNPVRYERLSRATVPLFIRGLLQLLQAMIIGVVAVVDGRCLMRQIVDCEWIPRAPFFEKCIPSSARLFFTHLQIIMRPLDTLIPAPSLRSGSSDDCTGFLPSALLFMRCSRGQSCARRSPHHLLASTG